MGRRMAPGHRLARPVRARSLQRLARENRWCRSRFRRIAALRDAADEAPRFFWAQRIPRRPAPGCRPDLGRGRPQFGPRRVAGSRVHVRLTCTHIGTGHRRAVAGQRIRGRRRRTEQLAEHRLVAVGQLARQSVTVVGSFTKRPVREARRDHNNDRHALMTHGSFLPNRRSAVGCPNPTTSSATCEEALGLSAGEGHRLV
jgi:hypothetical protein